MKLKYDTDQKIKQEVKELKHEVIKVVKVVQDAIIQQKNSEKKFIRLSKTNLNQLRKETAEN